MVILIAFALAYLTMNMLWLLLGAIINPNFFLVYTSSAVTLITFIVTKKKHFDKLSKGGKDMVKEILLKEYRYNLYNILLLFIY